MKRCNHCVWTKNNQQVLYSLLASTRISPSPLASCLSLPLVAPCFSPGTFSPAATSAAQWLRRSWSWGTAPLPSGPWWCLRRGGGQERIGVQCRETSRRGNMQMCRDVFKATSVFDLRRVLWKRITNAWARQISSHVGTQVCVFLQGLVCRLCVCARMLPPSR